MSYIKIVPAMLFVRMDCPFCVKVIEEVEKSGLDCQVLDFDSDSSIRYLRQMKMLVKEPPLLQTPDNFYVLPDFFDGCDLNRFDDTLLAKIMDGLTYIWN